MREFRFTDDDAAPNELRVAALAHAIECYAGPDDDTIPVLRHWLYDLRRAIRPANQGGPDA